MNGATVVVVSPTTTAEENWGQCFCNSTESRTATQCDLHWAQDAAALLPHGGIGDFVQGGSKQPQFTVLTLVHKHKNSFLHILVNCVIFCYAFCRVHRCCVDTVTATMASVTFFTFLSEAAHYIFLHKGHDAAAERAGGGQVGY